MEKIRSLDLEIGHIQSVNFSKDFEQTMKKERKHNILKFLLPTAILLLSIAGTLIFQNSIILMIGTGVSFVFPCITLTKELVKKVNKMNPMGDNNLVSLNNDKSVDDVLSKGMDSRSAKDFYTEKYNSFLKRHSSEESESYKKIRQQLESLNSLSDKEYEKASKEIDAAIFEEIKKRKPLLTDVSIDQNFSKEESEKKVVEEINAYSQIYKIPNLAVSQDEWDMMLNTIYGYLECKNITCEYYGVLSEIVRITLANSLLKNRSQIDIYNFISDLNYLVYSKINSEDINVLKEQIMSKIKPNEIVDFCEYKTHRLIK